MPERRKSEADQLRELRALVDRIEAVQSELAALRARRDMLIVGLHLRGASMRKIAEAARVQYTRVRQLVAIRDEISAGAGIETKRVRRRPVEHPQH